MEATGSKLSQASWKCSECTRAKRHTSIQADRYTATQAHRRRDVGKRAIALGFNFVKKNLLKSVWAVTTYLQKNDIHWHAYMHIPYAVRRTHGK